jgi:hypothetical protein
MNTTTTTVLATLLAAAALATPAMAADSPSAKPNATAVVGNNVAARDAFKAAIERARKPSAKFDNNIYGPYWVQFDPNYCNIAKLYVQGDRLYGSEAGCTDTMNYLYTGAFDAYSGDVYLNAPSTHASGANMWQVVLASNSSWLLSTVLDSNNALVKTENGPFVTGIYAAQPPGAAY